MSLSSASTDAQVVAAYDDNAGYDVDGSVAKCRLFIEACRIILRRRPVSQGGGRTIQYETIREELSAAKEWLQNHSTDSGDSGPRVTRVSFNNFR
ncbi:MAG TPA: hypothetical protein VEA69_15850 [Tepidisphaeraceae bacterium]|nr:hypothetical protein [Tepidisphaeraceae bacterium]